MSIFDKIKSAAGVGTPTVQVDVQVRPQKRGETLQAVIHVKGGEKTHKMRYLVAEISWEGKWTVRNADGADMHVEGKCWAWKDKLPNTEVTLEPGKVYDFPIAIRVPSDAPLSGQELTYQFWCRADIDDAPDPDFRTELVING